MGNKEKALFHEAMKMVDRNIFVPENVIRGTDGLCHNFVHPLAMSMRINREPTR